MSEHEAELEALHYSVKNLARRSWIRRFCPCLLLNAGVTAVKPKDLVSSGITAVLLDLDNTLTEWQSHHVSAEVREWLLALKAEGIGLCLVSNTRFGARLLALSEELDIPYIRRAFKPGRRGFQRALQMLNASPDHAVMIGDQMFTDVLGANRAGIFSIMVRPMARREFFGTRVSRLVERILMPIYTRKGWYDVR